MHQDNRFIEQITIIELLDTLITEHIDKTADKIQEIENTIYVIQHLKSMKPKEEYRLRTYINHKDHTEYYTATHETRPIRDTDLCIETIPITLKQYLELTQQTT